MKNYTILFARKYLLACLVPFFLILQSCERLEIRDSLESDSTPPGKIAGVQVKNLPGKAEISYTLPNDEDLLFVLAEYEIRPGVKHETKSSYYNNSLTVVGFGQEKEYPIHIYTVDRSGNRSESELVIVKPLKSPVQVAFEELAYSKTFGGISMSFKNESKADLAATVLIKDEFGDWLEYDKYYTALPTAAYAVRGLPANPTTFGVYISDRWENSSDTLIQEETPLFEKQLNKDFFRAVPLPGDAANTWALVNLWNDDVRQNSGFKATDAMPKRFQFDLGTTAKLSRFRIWGVHADGREYSSANLKEFEVWGSNAPNPNGSYDGWTLIDEYEVIRPSGLSPGDELTADDIAMAAAGFEFIIPDDAPAFRYIRFNMLSSFATPRTAATGELWLKELTFWGQDAL